MSKATFQIGCLNVVTGVSGAGKSSLVHQTLYPNLKRLFGGQKGFVECQGLDGWQALSSVELIDRRPIAKSSVSMPVTYLDLYTDLRKLFEQVPEAQIAGLTAKSFSLLSAGGRCEECDGRGFQILSMRFLADARVLCQVCNGRRFNDSVRSITYLGKSLDEVLEMTLHEASHHFRHHPRLVRRLELALDLGLGYLKLGQPSSTLSGGESQRLKLVPILAKARSDGHLLIIDEPTCGLHGQDVCNMLKIFNKIVDRGATLVVIEHHAAVIRAADWVIDVGPGSSIFGGQVVYEGQPRGLIDIENSLTGISLREELASTGGPA